MSVGRFDEFNDRAGGFVESVNFPPNVIDKHKAIGAAIFAGKVPTYQGVFEAIDCQSLKGWAWDASQPNTPISVDIYDGPQKLATVRANQPKAGVGNGQHGFTYTLPEVCTTDEPIGSRSNTADLTSNSTAIRGQ